ncbi:Patched domain-containing protein 3 [Holothuria leucospilota]|uniref:Patched domain-containing protein 3 n=1 Tax=Holothuria leucospilota TaxID=206669 RepID=A0A9Q1BW35_HOLLE|nr:Patched domain-containing protein 3 [Holothuria leucospilota]
MAPVKDASEVTTQRCLKSDHLRCIDNWFSANFYRFGTFVYRQKYKFLISSILLNLILSSGLLFLEVNDDLEYLFTPLGTPGIADKAVMESKFLVGDEGVEFLPDRILSSYLKHGEVIVLPVNGTNILQKETIKELLTLDRVLRTFEFEALIDGNVTRLTYEDLCMKWLGQCIDNPLLALYREQLDLFDVIPLTYPSVSTMDGREVFLAQQLMGVQATNRTHFEDSKNEVHPQKVNINAAAGISLYYFLQTGSDEMEEIALKWEEEAEQRLRQMQTSSVRFEIYFAFSYSLAQEVQKASKRVIPRFVATFSMLSVFAVLSMVTSDWVTSRPVLALLGVVSAAFAITSAVGMLAFCSVQFNEIVAMMPFLVIGVGVDDMFIMVSAWRQRSIYVSVEEKMGRTYSEAAVSITITNLTDIIAFLVGSSTPIPAVRMFCIYAGVAMFFAYLYQVAFFGACMAFIGDREKENRHCITFQKVKPKNASRNKFYRMFCAGGVPQEKRIAGLHREETVTHPILTFFRDYYSPLFAKVQTKLFALFLLVVCLLGSFIGCMNVTEGLRLHNLAPDLSAPWKFYNIRDQFLSSFCSPISVAFTTELEYWDESTQLRIENMTQHLEKSYYSYGRMYTSSWIRSYLWYLSNTGRLDEGMSDKKEFLHILKYEFLQDFRFSHFTLDIVFIENDQNEVTGIEASRIVLPTYGANDAIGEKSLMLDFRARTKVADMNATVFTPMFLVYDSYVGLITYTLQTVSIALMSMFVVAIVMIPHPICAVSVTLCAVSIDAAVLGYMSLWGVSLDIVSVINILLCIGFSVDFSAHITYAYVSSSHKDPTQRAVEAVRNLGTPIFLSAASSMIAIAPLSTASVYIFRTFFKTLFLVMAIGALHGLLFLPVILSLLGFLIPAQDKAKSETNVYVPVSKLDTSSMDAEEIEIIDSIVTSV